MEWPDYYPEQCPPKEATFINGSVYRFIGGETPQEKDFVPHFLLSNRIIIGGLCQACGLSVFKTREEIYRFSKRIPAFRRKRIVHAALDPSMGKILNTPSSHSKDHYTWWMPKHLKEPWRLFQVIENG